MDVDGNEIVLCKIVSTNVDKNGKAWFKREDIPKKLYEAFKARDKNIGNDASDDTCKTDKTKVNSCDYKTRTCGIQVLCSNCGIILGFRELFGSESCTQVGNILVDSYKYFQGLLKF